jgi:branched-chain amino acid transport system ATP-binding protein
VTSPLQLTGVNAYYGHFQALFGIDLVVPDGETLAVIGANGAGKTTLLKAVMGQVSTEGTITLGDAPLAALRTNERVRRGLSMVPEGRKLFPSLSVIENLQVGVVRGRTGPWSVDAVFDVFPGLPGVRGRPVATLSGGEQQAVAIARGLMANPDVLLLDEISLGLAPIVVERLYDALLAIGKAGLTMIVVEQDVGQALRVATRVHCLRAGRTVLSAPAAAVTSDAVVDAYFGGTV